ncbi:internalin A [Vigna unguiculata]|uniref:Internalin A n=1 Tax=Vigna unguiculata TaxID=3917 RepID=A0A4D6M1L4_VIGUN|nr:internalin A [Vigna unguiculata]
MVFINGKVRKCLSNPMKTKVEMLESDYTNLFDLRRFLSHGALMDAGLEKEWKHVEVTYEGVFETSVIKSMGVHVVKDKNIIMEDIGYDDPYTNIKKFENLTELNFDYCNLLTQIPNVSHLPNLEKLSFKECASLIAVDDSVGFLTKLKILIAEECAELKRFPPLNLPSLEELKLSDCFSLENFPEILGKTGKIKKLRLVRLPMIKELPVSFQNLTGLRYLEMTGCHFLRLNSNVLTSALTHFRVFGCKEWKWINSKDGEEVGSTVSSNLRSFGVMYCDLNDDIFSADFTHLTTVTSLNLSGTNITFLPECIKEFQHLDDLDVSYCKYLQEIRGIPPKLRKLRAKDCRSLTSSSSSMFLNQKFENLTELNFDYCNLLTQIPNVSHLPNLEKLSFKECASLIAVDDSVGFLTKLKILIAEECAELKRFPPLNLPSLEELKLSDCFSLENFPEILGKTGKIKKLRLVRLPMIKELPVSFQNLTGLRYLEMTGCHFLRLNSNVLTSALTHFRVFGCKEWKWINSKDGEEVGSTVSSNLRSFGVMYCDLNDDIFSADFTHLTTVTSLNLSGTNITFLPECIKEFQHLDDLDVSYCKYLQEIRGIPPKLRKLRAKDCRSLTSSSSSMFLNQQLHEARETDFIFPGGSIPRWFDKQSRGPSISFWFRNKFPAKVVCLLILSLQQPEYAELVKPMVLINGLLGGSYDYSYYLKREEGIVELDHVYLFDLRVLPFQDDLMEMPLEEEWKHVEVTYQGMFDTSLIKGMGIHVVKTERRSMEDIRYDYPL